MGTLKTSLRVNFGEYEDQSKILWEADDEREADEIYQQYVRLYPPDVSIRFATAGNLSSGSNKIDDIEEIVIFSGNNEVSLRYPEAYNVSIDLLGSFYDSNGNTITTTIAFDATKNAIVSTEVGYAACRVAYRARYRGFLYTFSGGPCPGLSGLYAPPTPVSNASPFKEAVLVALDPVRGAVASLNMDPPDCEAPKFFVNKGKPAELPRIDLMIDPKYPARLTDDISVEGETFTVDYLAAMCKVRLIPSVNAVEVDVNHPDANIRREDQAIEQDVAERILFSGSSTANLGYQAKSTVAMTPRGIWRDKSGQPVTVDIRGPGERFMEVDYTETGGYTNPRYRNVGPDELVCCDGWGKAIEAFGVVDVEYVYDYDLYRLDLPYADRQFRSVYVTALHSRAPDQQEPATLFIEAPSLEGLG